MAGFLDQTPPSIENCDDRQAIEKMRSYLDMLRREVVFQLNNIDVSNISQDFGNTCDIGCFSLSVAGLKTITFSQKPKLAICLGNNDSITFGWSLTPPYSRHVQFGSNDKGKIHKVIFSGLSAGIYTYIIFR